MDVFAAIADPVRRSILESLSDERRAAGEIATDFAISRPAVSRHLRVLREAGLVRAEVSGRERFYRLEPNRLGEVADWLERFQTPLDPSWAQRFDALETEVRRTTRERRTTTAPRRGRQETA